VQGYDVGNSRYVGVASLDKSGDGEASKESAGGGKGYPHIMGISPVPAREGAQVRLATLGQEQLSLEIYDVSGRVVRTLASGPAGAGTTDVYWDGRDERGARLPSGVYWCKLRSSPDRSRRIVVLR
jgi:hypothetical protein